MFHFVQDKVQGNVSVEDRIQRWKKKADEWENEVKKNEEVIKKLEKKREQYESEQ